MTLSRPLLDQKFKANSLRFYRQRALRPRRWNVGLEGTLTVGADVDVDVCDDVLDGVDDLLEDDTLAEFCLEHCC